MPRSRVNLGENVRNEMCDLLNRCLASTIDAAAQIKQAHWNVKGPSFIALHELFDSLRTNMDDRADLIGERIAQLGGIAHATVQIIAKETGLKAYPLEILAGSDHVDNLARSFAGLADQTRKGIEAAATAGDQVTSDILTEVTRGLDKDAWFLEAHLDAKS
jgi:starvation-inducible DNA-binding protein